MGTVETATSLSHPSVEIRDELLDWVVDFDQHWRPDCLESHLNTLPPHLRPWRKVATAELVKIDIAQQWRRASKVSVESYLKTYPELGTTETVPPDLILAELEARKLAGNRLSGRELNTRFPHQSQAVRQLLTGSYVIAKSGISRSRLSRTVGPGSSPSKTSQDTASVRPE